MAKEHIVRAFRNHFSFLKGEDIILYGTGQYTELLLKELKEFHFIGLMDQNKTGKFCYGLQVLSNLEVENSSCKNIIIVANLSVAPIIYKRIRDFVQVSNIEVYYMNGLKPAKDFSHLAVNPYWEQNKEFLIATAMQYDIISFDMFDTLVMRKCLYPKEVFELVNKRAEDAGILLKDFSKCRQEAEKILYHSGQLFYNLDNVYELLESQYKLDKDCFDRIKQLELNIELDMIMPRTDIVECFRILLDAGKKIVIVSDMYLSSEQLQLLLNRCGIQDCEIYVSNEYKASKYIGSLFADLKEKFAGKKILHIGDNKHSDIENAAKSKIDSCYIANADALMQYYGLDSLKALIYSDSGRYMYELFVQKCFESAFKRNIVRGKIYISCAKEIGYLFFGPLALGYMSWLIVQIQKVDIERILFVSRDGYIFYKIYQKLQKIYSQLKLPEARYFLTSRRCASVASLKSEKDVKFILEKVCYSRNMNLQNILEKVFGVTCDEQDSRKYETIGELGIEQVWNHINKLYMDKILGHAEIERARYLSYIQSLGILSNKIGMMNFVGRGLTQRCLQIIMEHDIVGLYFALEYDADELLNREKNNVLSWYTERISQHTCRIKLGEQLLQGETVFSAPHGAVVAFSDSGEPVYEQTLDSRVKLIEACHEGILQYIDDALYMENDIKIFSENIDMIDALFGMLTDERFIFSDEIKESFVFEDRYQ